MEIIDNISTGILRQKSPAQRIQMGFALWAFARKILMAHLKDTHTDWSEKEIVRETARRLSNGTN